MKVAFAPDSFKGVMTAREAAERMAAGFRRAIPRVGVRIVPMADGGEGTVQAVVDATRGRIVTRKVRGPRGAPVRAGFGLTGDGRSAVIEMAAASGLPLLTPAQRNPMLTSTFGTGELIRHAMRLGARRILVGIGGSATNDGGTGMARALGVRFLDARGRELPEGGGALTRLDRIDATGIDPALGRVTVEVACDVDNPLTGPRGAARIYGPQKGATPDMIVKLDRGLRRMARVAARDLGVRVQRLPGAGAAGGLGAGLVAFAGATLQSGVALVIRLVGLKRRLRGCELVVTGEGRLDAQTLHGKTIAGVARTARELGLPVIALCGSVGPDTGALHELGVTACFSTLRETVADDDIPRLAPGLLTDCAEQVARVIGVNADAPDWLTNAS